MLKKLQYNALKALGLVVYQPRNKQANIVPQHIRINARCLVLLYEQHQFEPQVQKIFTGMLSVLNLDPQEIMCATIQGADPDLAVVRAHIAQWQPEFILQLNMELPALVGQNCVRTYSPAYLLQNPQYKAQAYKTLLELRAMLHDPIKCNS